MAVVNRNGAGLAVKESSKQNTRRIEWNMSWEASEYLVIDLETTGLDPSRDHLISYGAVPVVGGKVDRMSSTYGLVRTEKEIPEHSVRIHGLSARNLRGARPINDCVDALDPMMRNRIIVAHCAWIEHRFLRRAFRSCFLPFDHTFIDTAELVRPFVEWPEGKQVVPLGLAAQDLGCVVSQPHHALGDALTTAEIFVTAARRIQSSRAGLLVTPADLLAR